MISDVYNIVLTPSKVLWKQSMVVMLSAITNCKRKCHFFIMQSDWNEKQKLSVIDFVSKYQGNSVDFVNVNNDELKFFKPWKGYYSAYYKTVAHLYLPNDLDRVLYLDCDTFVNKDIEKLYDMDFNDKFLIGCIERASLEQFNNESEAGLEKHGCLNTGVVLFNLEKFRQNINFETYKNIVDTFNDGYFADQGLLSYMFNEKMLLLPSYKYNHVLFQEGDRKKKFSYNYIFSLSKSDREKYLTEPYHDEQYDSDGDNTIFHFTGAYDPLKAFPVIEDGKFTYPYVPDLLSFNLEKKYAEPFWTKWWNFAQKLPTDIYHAFTEQAVEYIRNRVKQELTWMTNAKNFFEKLSVDFMTDSKFVNFIKSLNGKKVVLLKSQDAAGRFLTKILQNNKTEIIFSSPKPNLTKLTEDEWQKSKGCDFIICCDVHVTTSSERDGIKTVMLKDVLSDSTLSGKPGWNAPIAENNDSILSKIKNTNDEILDKVINLPAQFDEITKEHTESLIKQNEELTANLSDTSLKLRTAERQIKDLEIERDALKNRISKMQSTRSWRYTRIFRKNKKDEKI